MSENKKEQTETASEEYDRITSCGFAMYGEPALCTCGKCQRQAECAANERWPGAAPFRLAGSVTDASQAERAEATRRSESASQETDTLAFLDPLGDVETPLQAVWDAAWALHDPVPNGRQWKRSQALKEALDALILAAEARGRRQGQETI